MPPGVYVNGFLSFVIIAFCTHFGASGICASNLRPGIFPEIGGGGGILKQTENALNKIVIKFKPVLVS